MSNQPGGPPGLNNHDGAKLPGDVQSQAPQAMQANAGFGYNNMSQEALLNMIAARGGADAMGPPGAQTAAATTAAFGGGLQFPNVAGQQLFGGDTQQNLLANSGLQTSSGLQPSPGLQAASGFSGAPGFHGASGLQMSGGMQNTAAGLQAASGLQPSTGFQAPVPQANSDGQGGNTSKDNSNLMNNSDGMRPNGPVPHTANAPAMGQAGYADFLGAAGMGMTGIGMHGQTIPPNLMEAQASLQSNAGIGGASGMAMNPGASLGDSSIPGGFDLNRNILLRQMLSQQVGTPGTGLLQPYAAGNASALTPQQQQGMLAASTAGLPASYMNVTGAGNRGMGHESIMSMMNNPAARDGTILNPFARQDKKVKQRKPKNKPKRPLSAYNIFFKDERARILAEIPGKLKGKRGGRNDGESEADIEGKMSPNEDNGEGKDAPGGGEAEGEENNGDKDELSKTAGKKRKRVPHGKIGFENLAKIIGRRWKELPPDILEKYKKRAEDDMKRYRKEMEGYLQKQREGLEQSREQLENLVDDETKKRYFGDTEP